MKKRPFTALGLRQVMTPALLKIIINTHLKEPNTCGIKATFSVSFKWRPELELAELLEM